MEILGPLLVLVFAIAALILGVYVIAAICQLPFAWSHYKVRREIKRIGGFPRDMTHFTSGCAIAVNAVDRKLLLADAGRSKVYAVDDIVSVDADFKLDQLLISAVLRITIRDLETPYYSIDSYLNHKRLRRIVSLLTVLREGSAKPEDNAEKATT